MFVCVDVISVKIVLFNTRQWTDLVFSRNQRAKLIHNTFVLFQMQKIDLLFMVSEEKKKMRKQYLIQRSFRKQPHLFYTNPSSKISTKWDCYTAYQPQGEEDVFTPKSSLCHKSHVSSIIHAHTHLNGWPVSYTDKKIQPCSHQLYRPSTLEHSVSHSIWPDCTWCYLFVRFPQVLPRTPLNKTGLS